MIKKIVEDDISIFVSQEDPTKKMPVFYNPVMKHQRDITLSIIKHFNPKRVGLPLAGSGIRGLRILKHTDAEVLFNDYDVDAVSAIKKHLVENNFKADVFNQDANVFLRSNGIFDYIDIDPFGSSIPFIESAVVSLHHNGILAVTNTDTAALCGSYPKVCKRRYMSNPIESEFMHECGVRILIKKIQEIGTQHDVALVPILSYAKNHYMRVFFKVKKNKKACDELLLQHESFSLDEYFQPIKGNDYGPIWTGLLCDKDICTVLPSDSFTIRLQEELDILFGFDLHELCSVLGCDIPRIQDLIDIIIQKGFLCTRTIYCQTAIKTNMPKEDVFRCIKSLKSTLS